jgi:hypothetical protein
MREALAIVMAKRIGQVITPDLAIEMARELFPDKAIPTDTFAPFEYGMYTIQCERLAHILDDIEPLHAMHFAETERYRAGVHLKPDLDYMISQEHAGQLLQFTARIKETGELVGNMRLYLYRDLHAGVFTAKEDTFFVIPQHRGGFMAVRLWQFAERAVLSIGVREIRFSSKLSNGADRMAVYLGYHAVGMEFFKIFDESGQPIGDSTCT